MGSTSSQENKDKFKSKCKEILKQLTDEDEWYKKKCDKESKNIT